jgi:hypothetical protein
MRLLKMKLWAIDLFENNEKLEMIPLHLFIREHFLLNGYILYLIKNKCTVS